MESYLNDKFGEVKGKNSLEEALERWRKLCWLVKNRKRRFRFTANLSKRFEVRAIQQSNQAMLIAGTETSAMTMEAAVSFLISHPNILKKAIEEIEANTEYQKLLEDGDIAKLPYLQIQCIINETLRLGPTVSLLPPRESSADCTVGGYHVPHGTMLLFNARALQTPRSGMNLWSSSQSGSKIWKGKRVISILFRLGWGGGSALGQHWR